MVLLGKMGFKCRIASIFNRWFLLHFVYNLPYGKILLQQSLSRAVEMAGSDLPLPFIFAENSERHFSFICNGFMDTDFLFPCRWLRS